MPFFLFAVSQSEINYVFLLIAFIAIHLFFYPASNGYNSYFDKDEESIGGLETPPPVDKELYKYALAFDAIALVMAVLISWQFALLLLIMGVASKAYSHPSVRLKKYPILGLITVVFFQGAFTFAMSYLSVTGKSFDTFNDQRLIYAGILCSFMLLGSYPMTQVYQHGEDGRRGDKTFSRMLGVRGTFIWTMVIFSIATAGFFLFLTNYYSIEIAFLFLIAQVPTLIYFNLWLVKVWKDEAKADFKSTMQLNQISSVAFILFFIVLNFLK